MKRRRFLQSLAAASTIPLLRPFSRARATEGSSPKRLLIFWTPQGTVQNAFWPTGGERDFTLSRILAPLAAHRSDLIVLKGLHDEYFRGCSPDVVDGQHGFGTLCRLTSTCMSSTLPDSAGGPSIDQVIAGAIGNETLRSSLVLSGYAGGGGHRSYVNWDGSGKGIAPQDDAAKLWAQLFAGPAGADAARAQELRTLRKSALDLIRSDANALRARLTGDERSKMDAQLEAVRTLEKGLDRPLPEVCSNAAPFGGELPLFGLPSDPTPSRHSAMLDVIAASFACDVTRVATFAACTAGGDNAGSLRYFDPEWVDNYHSTGHAAGSLTDPNTGKLIDEFHGTLEQANEVMTRVGVYYAKLLASFIDRLKAIPEGDGTVWDNTIIYWCQEMAHGNHGAHDVPHVILGGGFHFDTGRFIDLKTPYTYNTVPRVPFADVLVSLANAMGVPLTTFGRADWCRGPLALLRG
jgi:hypothetical protein